ncbi:MAG: M23 family metallopeptidase [Spirochaetales bacterium]|nr:M23 family metallopeptidase [Spirochaetales bacterium]
MKQQKQRLTLVLFFLVLSLGSAQNLPVVFESVEGRSEIRPGEVVVLQVFGTKYEKIEVALYDSSNRVLTRVPGYVRETEGLGYAFLPIPNTINAGYYRIDVILNVLGGQKSTIHRIIRVSPRTFPEERITLTRELTNVRTANPSLRARESEILGQVLFTPNPKNWFWTDRFISPLENIRRTADYGARRLFLYDDGTSATSIHGGRDYGGPIGTPVMAPGAGRVVFSGYRQVTGWTIVLEHLPGIFTLYYHLDSLVTTIGQVVAQGEKIGELGSTGLATGPHLHWEARVLIDTVDPEFFIQVPLLDNTYRIFYNGEIQ